jgi:hypothetical protein
MTQQTWTGSSLVSEVLLDDIPDNETELYTRVAALETEVTAARDGEATLLDKEQAQDITTTEVIAARDGESSLLAKEQAQDVVSAALVAEVTAARDGESSLLAKEQAQDAQIAAAQVIVTTGYPSQSGKAGWSLSTDGAMPIWKDYRNTVLLDYADRGTLRTTVVDDKSLAVVEELGLFVYSATSTEEPDDDETCFSTAEGQWLLESVHWNLISAWQFPDWQYTRDTLEDLNERISDSVIVGSVTCSITSIATLTSTAFSGTVRGAEVGDVVIVNPPAALGTDAASTGRLSFHAYISAADIVTVQLCNASASTATTNAAIQTPWPVMVIKET